MKNLLHHFLSQLFVLYVLFSIMSLETTSQNLWQEINTIESGAVNSIAKDTNNIIYIATEEDGLYYCDDSGEYWNKIIIDFGYPYNKTIRAVAISKSNYIFIGTIGLGVYKSTDKGNSWMRIAEGLDFPAIRTLSCDKNGSVYAGTNDGIYKMNEDDEVWERSNNGIGSKEIYAIEFDSLGNIYAGTSRKFNEGGIYKSNDDGKSWTALLNGAPEDFVFSIAINNENHIFIGTDHSGIYKSTDGGMSWKFISIELPDYPVRALAYGTDSAFIYAGLRGGGIYFSTNNGTNWKNRFPDYKDKMRVEDIKIYNNSIWIASFSSGVLSSTDAGSGWLNSNKGLSSAVISSIIYDDYFNYLFVSTLGDGIWKCFDNGSYWIKANPGLDSRFIHALLLTSSNNLFAGIESDGLYLSSDGGFFWGKLENQFKSNTVNSIIELAENDTISTIVGTSGLLIYKMTNPGGLWMPANKGIDPSATDCQALFISSNGYIYASIRQYGIYRSSDIGDSWQQINNGLLASTALSFAEYGGTLYAGTLGGGLFKTTDNGDTWELVFDDDGKGIDVKTICIVDTNTILIGTTKRGIFSTNDVGKTWQPDNPDDEDYATVNSIFYDNKSNIFAGLNGGGLFRKSVLSSVPYYENNKDLSMSINPTFADKQIEISIALKDIRYFKNIGCLKLKIFNILGEVIFTKELNNFYGTTKATIDVSGYSYGFYTLFVYTEKDFIAEKFIKK